MFDSINGKADNRLPLANFSIVKPICVDLPRGKEECKEEQL